MARDTRRRAIDQEARRARVAELLLARWSYREIAADLRVTKSTVQRDVATIREEWRAQRVRSLDEHVAEELARLQAAEHAIWLAVVGGDTEAIAVLLRIQRRRAMLLGLDAPKRIAAEGTLTVVWRGADPDDV